MKMLDVQGLVLFFQQFNVFFPFELKLMKSKELHQFSSVRCQKLLPNAGFMVFATEQ